MARLSCKGQIAIDVTDLITVREYNFYSMGNCLPFPIADGWEEQGSGGHEDVMTWASDWNVAFRLGLVLCKVHEPHHDCLLSSTTSSAKSNSAWILNDEISEEKISLSLYYSHAQTLVSSMQRTLTYFVWGSRYHCTADLLFDWFGFSFFDYV